LIHNKGNFLNFDKFALIVLSPKAHSSDNKEQNEVLAKSRDVVLFAILLGQFFKNFSGQIGDLNLAKFIPENLGGNAAIYGFAVSIYAIAQFLLMVPFSRLSDRIGRKKVLIICFSLFMIGSFLCFQAKSLWELMLYRIIQGTGAYSGTLMALINDHYDETERSRPLALQQTAVGIGALLGVGIGGILVSLIDTRVVFLIVGGISLVGTVILFVGVQDQLSGSNSLQNVLTHTGSPHLKPPSNNNSIERLKSNRILKVSIVFFMIRWFCFQGIAAYCNYSLFNYYNLSGFAISAILFPMVLIYIIALIISGKKKNSSNLIQQGFVLLTIALMGLILLQLWNNIILFALWNCLASFSIGWMTPANDTIASNAVEQKDRGHALGLYNSIGLSGGIIGPIIIGLLGDILFTLPYVLMAFLGLLGMVISFRFSNKFQKGEKMQEF
jgi:MFS family permease